jgi:hypothetical protein
VESLRRQLFVITLSRIVGIWSASGVALSKAYALHVTQPTSSESKMAQTQSRLSDLMVGQFEKSARKNFLAGNRSRFFSKKSTGGGLGT